MPNPKLVQISSAMVAIPVFHPDDPTSHSGAGRVEYRVQYQINALDEEGHAWELVKAGPEDPGTWSPLTRTFVGYGPAQNGAGSSPNPTITHREATS